MYENQLDFIKPNKNDSFSGIYYSDINNNEFSQHNNQFNENYNLILNNCNNNNKDTYNNYQMQYQQNHLMNNFQNINNPSSQKYLYIDEKNKIMKQNEINNEVYARNQHLDYPEQLDYMNQNNINIFPNLKPVPLIYNGLNLNVEKSKRKLGKKSKSKTNKKSIGAAWEYNKNFISNLKNKMKNKKTKNNNINNIVCLDKNCKDDDRKLDKKNFNFNTNKESKKYQKGLFDPDLKSNELEFPRKTVIQRLERLEKIKNYDVKFGSKVRKLEVYNNIVDMFEDLAFDKEEKNFRKKDYNNRPSKSINKHNKDDNKNDNFNILNYNIPQSGVDDVEKIIKANNKKYKTNLNFDFSHQEQIIKALEDQIQQERKLRSDVNMKYLKKMKELEENKIKDFIKITARSLSKSASRSKSKGRRNYNDDKKQEKLFKAYIPQYNLIKENKSDICDKFSNPLNHNSYKYKILEKEKNKFVEDIENSINIVRKQNNFIDDKSKRVKSEEAIKIAMNEIMPKIDKVVEKDFKKILNNALTKKNTEQKTISMGNRNINSGNKSYKKNTKNPQKNKILKKIYSGNNILNSRKDKYDNNYNNIEQNLKRRILDLRESDNSSPYNLSSGRKNHSLDYINNSYNKAEYINHSIKERSQIEQENFDDNSTFRNERFNNNNNNTNNHNSLSLSKKVFYFYVFLLFYFALLIVK